MADNELVVSCAAPFQEWVPEPQLLRRVADQYGLGDLGPLALEHYLQSPAFDELMRIASRSDRPVGEWDNTLTIAIRAQQEKLRTVFRGGYRNGVTCSVQEQVSKVIVFEGLETRYLYLHNPANLPLAGFSYYKQAGVVEGVVI